MLWEDILLFCKLLLIVVVLHRTTGHALEKPEYLLQVAIHELLVGRLHRTTGHGLLALLLIYSLLLRSCSTWLYCTRLQDTLCFSSADCCSGAAHGVAAQDHRIRSWKSCFSSVGCLSLAHYGCAAQDYRTCS